MKKIKGNRHIYFDKPRTIGLKYIAKSLIYPVLNLAYRILYSILPFQIQKNAKYQFSICAIFKNESSSLKEWIEFHKIIGIEHFYLYNNNSTDNFQEIIEPYLKSGDVTLIDWPQEKGQFSAYMHWLENSKKETQWVTFLDLDEFICPVDCHNIGDWINKRKKYPVVEMYWRMFTSSGKLKHDPDKLNIEQYIVASDKLVDIGKVFYNTCFEIYKPRIDMMHRFTCKWRSIPLFPVNEWGNLEWRGISKFKQTNSIQVNHYWGRALDLYMIKKKRGSATGMFSKSFEHYLGMEYISRIADYTIYKYLIPLKLIYYKIEI